MSVTHSEAAVRESNGDATAAQIGDPVLRALGQAAEQYRALKAVWERDAAEVAEARAELARARESVRRGATEVQQVRAELEAERKRALRQKERADRLGAALKDVHRAAFSGNVFELILKACVTITGATRGLYVTAWETGRYRVRAAIDADGYPRKAPSAFVRALCERVIGDRETFVADAPAALRAFPAPDGPGEAFANCLAAPAVLLKQFNGVVILADKPGGGFDPEDVALVMSIGDQGGIALHNRHLQDELFRAYFSVVGVLADAIEAKDPYTKGHCEMVARLARRTAVRLHADDDTLRSVTCYGGLLHDIGKIGVSDGVLNKPGKLSPEEWVLMQSHVRIGRDLLANVPALDGVADVVMHHHERYDGAGYPDGLAAERISLAARVVCVVDAYSAMVAKRSYKDSMSADEARQELVKCKGSHFDPRVVDAFLAVLDESADDPDGYALLPELDGAGDFYHALRAAQPRRG